MNISLAVWLLKGFIDKIPQEYAFPVLLTSDIARTASSFIPAIIGVSGQDWPAVAARATVFPLPVMALTVLFAPGVRGGPACLNSFRTIAKWMSALVTPPPGLASAD
ncbi:MAG: hypothetical protein WBP18_00780 [Paracoccaceae bacterium]